MKLIWSILTLLIFTGCAKPVKRLFKDGRVKKSTAPYVQQKIYKQDDLVINYGGSDHTLHLRYLGCGGFYLANEDTGLLIDPFFSNRGLFSLQLFGVKTNTQNVAYGLKGLNQLKTKVHSIFVTHAHYDHLMDVPYVFEKYLDTENAKIYCSKSGKNLIENVVGSAHVVDLEEERISSWYERGKSYEISNTQVSVVVTPIATSHAPHYKNISMYQGEAEAIRGYSRSTDRTKTKHWKLGQTLAYLIDFRDKNDRTTFRVYLQSSAAPPKYGWIHDTLRETPINLAIIGAASFDYTNNYPEALINHLNPEKVIICHWEDFFVPYQKEKKKIVRLTNLKDFINRLNAVFPYEVDGEEKFMLPKPGVDLLIQY